jgi:hypothetical protein
MTGSSHSAVFLLRKHTMLISTAYDKQLEARSLFRPKGAEMIGSVSELVVVACLTTFALQRDHLLRVMHKRIHFINMWDISPVLYVELY